MAKTEVEKQAQKIKIEYVQPKDIKRDPRNPRSVTEEQLQGICRSIVEFGFVDPLILRDDGLILGGHQRLTAVEKLLSGPFKYKGKDGKPVVVKWKMPPDGLPAVRLEHLDDKRSALLNLALNRAGGDWEYDSLAKLLKELSEGDDALDLHELAASAFTPAEITDYIDIASEPVIPGDGEIPQPNTQAPKLTLDFTSKAARDAVKAAIGAQAKGEEPSGEVLARMLGVKPKKTRRAA